MYSKSRAIELFGPREKWSEWVSNYNNIKCRREETFGFASESHFII